MQLGKEFGKNEREQQQSFRSENEISICTFHIFFCQCNTNLWNKFLKNLSAHVNTPKQRAWIAKKKSRNDIQVLRFSNKWKWIWFRRPNKTITSRTRRFSWKCNQFSDYPNLNYVKCLNENANQWTMHSYQCYNRMPINQYRTYKLINKQKCNGMLLHFQLYRK